jgi:hypothetical protein
MEAAAGSEGEAEEESEEEESEGDGMTVGAGGKYDSYCEALFVATQASATFVAIVGGNRGSGFSMSVRDPRILPMLAGVLRDIANQLESDAKKL